MRKSVYNVAMAGALVLSKSAFALPLLSTGAASANGRVMFFKDHQDNTYWYMPTVVDPVLSLDGRAAKPVVKPGQYLYFAYSGQPQAKESDLEDFAKDRGLRKTDLKPVYYEKTENAYCMNLDASKVTIQIPNRIGSFLEHVPVTVYTKDAESIEILSQALGDGSGINCHVQTYIKGVTDAYSIDYVVRMNDLFDKFEANAHAGGWFWEVDINTLLKNYARDGLITITEFVDGNVNMPQIVSADDNRPNAKSIFMGVFELVKQQLFVRKTSIPDHDLPGRGAPFSLRVDYSRSTEHFEMKGHLNQQTTVIQPSEMQIRVAPPRQ